MKKKILILMVVAVSSVCYAQRIKVHQGNNINSFLLSNVDSISHDENESVNVYYNSQHSFFSVNNVDSLSINPERLECYNISPEQLNGWDAGVFSVSNVGEDFYIVSKKNDDENGEETVTICINSFANDVPENTINFIFDNEGNLQEIITAGYQFKAQKYLDEFIFVVYKDGDYVGTFNVPCEVINENGNFAETNSRRSTVLKSYRNPFFNSKGKISLPKIKDFAGKAYKLLKPAGEVLGIAINLNEGKYGETLMDLVVGGLIGLADLPVAPEIIAEEVIKRLLKYCYEQDIKKYIGEAKIEITSVKRTNESAITVEGTISGISSIPSTVMVGSLSDGYFDEIPNKVYWGVAEGNSGQPGMHLNNNSSGVMPISNDKFSYTFYIDRVPGQVLYFRPFLAPDVTMNDIYTCIRYGERKEFIDVDVELSNFKLTKIYKENDKYKAQFTIDGSIPGLFQELSGWGFDVKTKSGNWQRFYAKENPNDYYPPVEKSFTCNITIEDDEISDYGLERIAEITITPFVTYWNRLPPATFLEEKNYTITLNGLCPDSNHPHMIDLGLPSGTKWACCNVGASTPEDYGNYYAWGETQPKNVYNSVTYLYCTGQDIDGDGWIDKNLSFVNIGSDIAGTQYDAATANWGTPWCMPSRKQMQELLNKCTHKWTTRNGVSGREFVGPNGGTIFLPAAGGRWYGDRFDQWTYGHYWSSTLYDQYITYGLQLSSSRVFLNNTDYYRLFGFPVRPVR